MKKYTITLDDEQMNKVIMGIHAQYLYYGQEYTDDEVYEFNSELDELLVSIKAQMAEQA